MAQRSVTKNFIQIYYFMSSRKYRNVLIPINSGWIHRVMYLKIYNKQDKPRKSLLQPPTPTLQIIELQNIIDVE